MKDHCHECGNETDEKLSMKDIYDELWRGRDFELSHLWQRSIFVMSLLIMLIPAYLVFFESINADDVVYSFILGGFSVPILKGSSADGGSILHGWILLGIAFVIEIVSIYYITIAKGSKYWYESYENSISKLYDDYPEELMDEDLNRIDFNERCRHLLDLRVQDYGIPHHGKLKSPRTNNNILSTDPGDYSVSRVNIVLGIVSLIVGCVFVLLACIFMIASQGTSSECIVSLVLAVLISVFLYLFLPNTVIAHYDLYYRKSRERLSIPSGNKEKRNQLDRNKMKLVDKWVASAFSNVDCETLSKLLLNDYYQYEDGKYKFYMNKIFSNYTYRGIMHDLLSSNLPLALKSLSKLECDDNRDICNLNSLFSKLVEVGKENSLSTYMDECTGKEFSIYWEKVQNGNVVFFGKYKFFFNIPWNDLLQGRYDLPSYKHSGRCVWSYLEDSHINYGSVEIEYDEVYDMYFTVYRKDGMVIERKTWKTQDKSIMKVVE